MLPRLLVQLSTRVEGDRIIPHYLTARDEPWLRALLDEQARCVGLKLSELRERMKAPLTARAPKSRLRMALHVLNGLAASRSDCRVPPRDARFAVFEAAAAGSLPRVQVLTEVAARFGVRTSDLEEALFADLGGERRVAPLPCNLSPSQLALEVNHALVVSLLRRAHRVRVTAWGNTRALVRHARLVGLICAIAPELDRASSRRTDETFDAVPTAELPGVSLEISGPFALFRRTEVYGRALASLLPRLAWCHDFELEAACALGRGGHLATLVVRSGDPIMTGRELRRYDSRVEERFAIDFGRAAPDWNLVREPQPIAAGGTLIFPDFELVHRQPPSRRWLLEIIGFWTPEYLSQKLSRLREARVDHFILCIDEKLHCSDAELPADARVIRYKTRIRPADVLAIVAPS